jgi:putative tryptophan/tyrosine transport system substrate-binding protein
MAGDAELSSPAAVVIGRPARWLTCGPLPPYRPDMDRRRFLVTSLAGCLVAPLAARAQKAGTRVPTVGVLHPGLSGIPGTIRSNDAFERGLKEAGWIPGQTIRVEYRYAEGRIERLDKLARELVRLRVDVIVARATSSVLAAKKATTTTPIVMSASGHDPVELGLAASLARPGGNVTGLTLLNEDLYVKHLEALKEMVPRLSKVAVLGSQDIPLSPKGRHALEVGASVLGLRLDHIDVRHAEDLRRAFSQLTRGRAGGLLVRADPSVLEPNYKQVLALVETHELPAIYWLSIYAEAGGLISYGADLMELHRQSASYVTRLLRNAQPSDLPIEEPTKFSLIINLKTAKALGLTVPPSLLGRADQVIE